MGGKLTAFIILYLNTSIILSQDYYGYTGSNYSGIGGIIANPGSAADNKLKIDVNLFGVDFTFNNSWLAIKQESLTRARAWTWRNSLSGDPDNVYKNFTYEGREGPYSVVLEQRFTLPSVFYQLNKKNALAFTCNLRFVGNIDGISPKLAHLFENEFDLSVTRNNPTSNRDFKALQMSWVEYGLTYGRVLIDKGQHFLKAGATPKILKGIQSAYVMVDNLDFLFSNKDTSSFLTADVSFARSAGVNSAVELNPTFWENQHNTTAHLGLDLGFVYEWRPDKRVSSAQAPGRRTGENAAGYKLKFGASLVDIGKIRFQKAPNYYDIHMDIDQSDIINYISAKNARSIDSMLQADFPLNTGPSEFTVLLPMALNLQLDYQLYKRFYAGVTAHLSEFNRQERYRVHNYSVVTFAPRYESYWLDVSIPITYNVLSAKRAVPVSPGFSLRAGPLTVGCMDLGPLFRRSYASMNVFALLKIPIADTKKQKKSA